MVSLPATREQQEERVELQLGEPLAVHLAGRSWLARSSRGLRLALLGELVRVGRTSASSPLRLLSAPSRTRGSSRRAWLLPTRRTDGGRACGHAQHLDDHLQRQLGRHSVDEVAFAPRGRSRRRSRAPCSRMCARAADDAVGVKPALHDAAELRVLRRVHVDAGSPGSAADPRREGRRCSCRRAEEKVFGSFEIRNTSAWRVMAQKPGPPRSRCRTTGVSARSRVRTSWGTPRAKSSQSSRPTSMNGPCMGNLGLGPAPPRARPVRGSSGSTPNAVLEGSSTECLEVARPPSRGRSRRVSGAAA